jgi:hypothetical protein
MAYDEAARQLSCTGAPAKSVDAFAPGTFGRT